MVDLATEFQTTVFNDDLAHTINYESLNLIIQEEMKNTQKLLETVLNNIISKVIKLYPFVETVNVSIKKLNPPMQGQIGFSFVKLSYTSAK